MGRGKKQPDVDLPFPPPGWFGTSRQDVVWQLTDDLEGGPLWIDLVQGRGSGKDVGVIIPCIFRDALKLYKQRKEEPDRLERNPLVSMALLAPQDSNLVQAVADFRGMLQGLARVWGPMGGYDPSESDWLFKEAVREDKFIIFGRGEIELQWRVTSTKDSCRGPGWDLVWITEYAIEPRAGQFERAFDGELPGTITRPGRFGRVYTSTTPKGPNSAHAKRVRKWYGEDVLKVTNDVRWSADRLKVYVHRDSMDPELFTPAQLRAIEAEKINGWLYEQEREAKYVVADLGGAKAFARAWVLGCVRPRRPVEYVERNGVRVPKWRRVIFGQDIARLGDDATFLVGMDEDTGELVRVERHEHLTGREVVAVMVRLKKEFPGCRFRVDDTGHRGYIADFAPADLVVIPTQFSREKEKWVAGLAMLLQAGMIWIPDPQDAGLSDAERDAIWVMIRELLAYAKIIHQDKRVEFRHPDGEHDDGVDGLMLAAMDRMDAMGMPDEQKTREDLERLGVL